MSSAPLRNSCKSVPFLSLVKKTRIKVPRSEAVASSIPERDSDQAANEDSCASM